MSTDPIPAPSTPTSGFPTPRPASRPTWRVMVSALLLLTGAFSVVTLAVLPTSAQAATMVVDQCNSHGPGPEGATTAMSCTVTVVNTINGTSTYSTTTVTRLCTLGPCSTPNGTSTTSSVSLVTAVRQCNNSDNDAAHAIRCRVTITNNIGRNTPGVRSLSAPRVTQCAGSAKGGAGVADCGSAPATGAMVSQCNGSGNGGGGTVRCSVDPRSRVSGAIPLRVTQCNGTGNVGGSTVSCQVSVITNLTNATPIPVAATVATSAPTPTTTSHPTSAPAAATTPAPWRAPQALSAAGTSPTPAAGGQTQGLLMLGAGLVLAGAIGALLFRRFGGKDLVRRLTRSG